MASSTFYYFSFGSNLKKERILINCKSAKLHCTAELKDYRLAFTGNVSRNWGGQSATILPSNGDSVWGAVWVLTKADVSALDRQEGVFIGIYKRINIDVYPADEANAINCISYIKPSGQSEGKPSLTYMKVIISGAKEISLPPEYILKLESIEHNGQGAKDKDFNKLVT